MEIKKLNDAKLLEIHKEWVLVEVSKKSSAKYLKGIMKEFDLLAFVRYFIKNENGWTFFIKKHEVLNQILELKKHQEEFKNLPIQIRFDLEECNPRLKRRIYFDFKYVSLKKNNGAAVNPDDILNKVVDLILKKNKNSTTSTWRKGDFGLIKTAYWNDSNSYLMMEEIDDLIKMINKENNCYTIREMNEMNRSIYFE